MKTLAPGVRRARRIAVLSDVHGNATALAAVLDELTREEHDLIVFGGDLTWGAQPVETYQLASTLDALFVRGNADRVLIEGAEESERERWLQEQHTAAMRAFVGGFEENIVVEVEDLGAVRFCHGSPRSDEECVTPETPDDRVREFSQGVPERLIVSAHVHIQFDREVAGIRSINAGSVGLPYEGRPGAFWALLGPDVEFRTTDYDVERAAAAYRASGFPDAEQLTDMLLAPPAPAEVIEDAERRIFAG
jgi:predicted phosphodiesterase